MRLYHRRLNCAKIAERARGNSRSPVAHQCTENYGFGRTYLVGVQSEHFVESGELHAAPRTWYIEKYVESSSKFGVFEKSFQISLTATSETSPPLRFTAKIPLKMILTDFAVDLAVGSDFLI